MRKIGGSSIAGICGISPWMTPLDEYMKITGQAVTAVNPAMEWGLLLEPVIREKYMKLTGRSVEFNQDPSLFGLQVVHPDFSFLVGSLDGIADGNRVLEIKTARSRDAWSDGVPDYYELQVQFYLALTGFETADVAVLFGGSDFQIFEVGLNNELIETMTALLVRFWQNHIETGIPPECTTPADRNIRWPLSETKSVEADPQTIETLSVLKNTRDKIKLLEAIQDQAEAQIKDFMQENDSLLVSGKPAATWKISKSAKVFDKARFEAENYELYEKFLTTKPGSRRFLLK